MSSKPTYYNLWTRRASNEVLNKISELLLQEIPNKLVRTTLRWSRDRRETHLYPAWNQTLFDLLGLEGFRAYRQFLALFQKNADLVIDGQDKEKNAWESYCKAEVLGGIQNRRMRNHSQFWAEVGPDDSESLDIALDLISDILGPCPALADLRCIFGPGANVTCRQKTSARCKLSAPLGISAEGLKEFPTLAALYPAWLMESDGVTPRTPTVECAEVQQVTKNALTNRTIELQPLLNTFVQLGIGRHLKKRLRLFGINLFRQDINQNRARRASLTGLDATLDAEGASDSITVRTVQFYLQRAPGWFDLLSTWRCGDTTCGDLRFNSEKFSAMGNGYTFELESLLFWAIAEGVRRARKCRGRVTIYGDDLICPVTIVEPVVRLYGLSGFRINKAKSFWSGNFRESCGGDYVLGDNVRPFYVKDRLTDARLAGFANFLLSHCRFTRLWVFLFDLLVGKEVLTGPADAGDGHLWDPNYEPELYIGSSGATVWHFDTILKVPCKDGRKLGRSNWDAVLPSYVAYIADMEGDYTPRDTAYDPYTLRGSERCKTGRMLMI